MKIARLFSGVVIHNVAVGVDRGETILLVTLCFLLACLPCPNANPEPLPKNGPNQYGCGVYGVFKPPPPCSNQCSMLKSNGRCRSSCCNDLDPAVTIPHLLRAVARCELFCHCVLRVPPSCAFADAAFFLLALLDGFDDLQLLESRVL